MLILVVGCTRDMGFLHFFNFYWVIEEEEYRVGICACVCGWVWIFVHARARLYILMHHLLLSQC